MLVDVRARAATPARGVRFLLVCSQSAAVPCDDVVCSCVCGSFVIALPKALMFWWGGIKSRYGQAVVFPSRQKMACTCWVG